MASLTAVACNSETGLTCDASLARNKPGTLLATSRPVAPVHARLCTRTHNRWNPVAQGGNTRVIRNA
jgi:hypothetical protein